MNDNIKMLFITMRVYLQSRKLCGNSNHHHSWEERAGVAGIR